MELTWLFEKKDLFSSSFLFGPLHFPTPESVQSGTEFPPSFIFSLSSFVFCLFFFSLFFSSLFFLFLSHGFCFRWISWLHHPKRLLFSFLDRSRGHRKAEEIERFFSSVFRFFFTYLFLSFLYFRCVLASLQEGVSACPSIR